MRQRPHPMLLGLLLSLSLAACQRTVFESPPSTTPGCDPALVGVWLSEADGSGQDGELRAEVSAECRLITIEQKQEGPRRSEPTTLATANVAGQRLLWVDAGWAHRTFDVDGTALDTDGDVYIFAYSVQRDRLRLSAPPHRSLAKSVIDRDVPGEVLMHDDELVVRVSGDTASLRRTLGKFRIFRDQDGPRFRRAAEGESP